jgi:hypothetical protein
MRNWIARFIASHLPKRVVHQAAIRIWAFGTTGQYSNQEVPALTVVEAASRWDKEYKTT